MQSRGLGASPVRLDALSQQATAAFALTQLPEADLDTVEVDPAVQAFAAGREIDSASAVESRTADLAAPMTARHVVDRLRAERLEQVPLSQVRDASNQPRRWYDPKSLAELTADIRDRGLFQPVVVRTLGETEHEHERGSEVRYELVFGHRRLRAFQRLAADPDPDIAERFASLPAFVARPEEMTALEARLLTSAENRQRDDLSPIELARDVVGVRDMLAAEGLGFADYDLAVFY